MQITNKRSGTLVALGFVFFFLLGTTQTKAIDNTGLVDFLSMNSSVSNPTATNDSSGLGSNAVVQLSQPVYNSAEQFYQFTNSTAKINSTISTSMESIVSTQKFSLQFWITNSTRAQQYSGFPAFVRLLNSTGSTKFLFYGGNASDVFSVQIYNHTANGDVAVTDTGKWSSWNQTDWHLITLVIDQCGTNKVTAYIDAVEQLSVSTGITNCTFGTSISSGAMNIGINTYMGIRNFRMYNRTLLQPDIQQFFDIGRFENGSQTATVDYSTSVGTINNLFYGAGVYPPPSNDSWLSVSGNGTADTQSNDTFLWNALNSANMNIIRMDTRFETLYSGNNTSISWYTNNQTDSRNIRLDQNTIKNASLLGKKVVLVIGYMPSALANLTSDCYNEPSYCSTTNFTFWESVVTNYITNVTQNCLYESAIEIDPWNEPDNNYWLKNVTRTNTTREQLFMPLLNATIKGVQNACSGNIPVHTPGFADLTPSANGAHFVNAVVGNQSGLGNGTNPFKFASLNAHLYRFATSPNFYNYMSTYTDYMNTLCTTYSLNCSRRTWGEWRTSDNYTTFNTTQDALQNKLALMFNLNNYPANVSMLVYRLNDISNYSTPYWQILSEPALSVPSGAYYQGYLGINTTAEAHRPGNTVATSTMPDTTLKVTGSKNSTFYGLTLATLVSGNRSISISGITNLYNARNIVNSTTYSITNGILSISMSENETIDLELQTDSTAPSFVVSAPSNGTNYGSNNITVTFNVTDSQGGLDSVWYNNGTANITVGSGLNGNTSFNYTNTTIVSSGNRTLTFYANDTLGQTTSTTVTFSVGLLTITASNPSTPHTIFAGDSTNFSITLNNPLNASRNINWTTDGTNQVACFNQTYCVIATTNSTQGTFTIAATVRSSINDLSNTWSLVVNENPAICGTTGISGVVNYIGILFVVFSLVAMILRVTSGIFDDNLGMVLAITALGFILIILSAALACA